MKISVSLAGTLVSLAWVLANLLMCGLAGSYYLSLRRLGLLLIAIACGIGAISNLLPWLTNVHSSSFWLLVDFFQIVDAVLWVFGSWLLFKDLAELIRRESSTRH